MGFIALSQLYLIHVIIMHNEKYGNFKIIHFYHDPDTINIVGNIWLW
jgi:hypothetical protein